MAQLKPNFPFTGSFGDLSIYKMKGFDKLIVRSKGGARKEKIKKAPQFEITRRLNAEFGGRATTSKWALQALQPVMHISDHSISGKINALLKPAQEMDTTSDFGQRHVQLSLQPRLLEGLNLNRKNPFETVITNPLYSTLSRETRTGTVEIPVLRPGINLHAPDNFYLYRLKVMLGIIPDVFYNPSRVNPYDSLSDEYEGIAMSPVAIHSEWFTAQEGSPALKMEIHLPDPVPIGPAASISIPDNHFSLVMAFGLELGVGRDQQIQPAKYVGCAKVLAMA
jgi:hypothetical protein